MTELPYERAAMNGEPLPDNITSEADKLCYYGLVLLYELYHAKKISREDATKRKQAMLYELDKAKRMDEQNARLAHAIARTYKECEISVTEYRKYRELYRQEQTTDNAAALVRVMDMVIEALYPTIKSVEMEDI